MRTTSPSTAAAGFSYSPAFHARIVELHRGKEGLPHYQAYLEAHLGGPASRLVECSSRLVREMEDFCGPLRQQRVLDVGCGTGATTAALAQVCESVAAFDVDAESVDIARRRLQEHGAAGRVRFFCAPDLEALAPELGTFDVVLMNGVLEHIPLSIPGLRARVLQAVWRRLAPGGRLFINDTPNRLWPVDGHSTQLWGLPWTPAGCRLAYRYACARGRHADSPTASPGPRGLEEVGAWGATWWELQRYLAGQGARCLNLEPAHSRQVQRHGPRSWKRRAWETALHPLAVRVLKLPLTALAPSLTHLVFEKPRG